jgi:hypothetical protein
MLSQKTRERAFAMFCLGIPAVKIAELLHLRDSAILSIWKTKYNWDQNLEIILKYKDNNTKNLNSEQQLKIVDSIMTLWLEAMAEDKLKLRSRISPKDLLDSIRVHRLIEGESTENLKVDGKLELNDFINEIRERRKNRG